MRGMTVSTPGFILLDAKLHPVAYNSEAVQILCFPMKPDRVKQVPLFLSDKIRSSLLNRHVSGEPEFVREYKSGQRLYTCRAFHVDSGGVGERKMPFDVALLLERLSHRFLGSFSSPIQSSSLTSGISQSCPKAVWRRIRLQSDQSPYMARRRYVMPRASRNMRC